MKHILLGSTMALTLGCVPYSYLKSSNINPFSLAAYLKTAEGLEGEAGGGVHGTELWALAVGATVAILLLLVLLALLCFAHR